MNRRIKRRLEKLEAVAQTEAENWNYGDVQSSARKKLTPTELDLLEEAIALFTGGQQGVWTEGHDAVWKRWDAALYEATKEVGFPVFIGANDSFH